VLVWKKNQHSAARGGPPGKKNKNGAVPLLTTTEKKEKVWRQKNQVKKKQKGCTVCDRTTRLSRDQVTFPDG